MPFRAAVLGERLACIGSACDSQPKNVAREDTMPVGFTGLLRLVTIAAIASMAAAVAEKKYDPGASDSEI